MEPNRFVDFGLPAEELATVTEISDGEAVVYGSNGRRRFGLILAGWLEMLQLTAQMLHGTPCRRSESPVT
jgi:hypothetical protein